MWRFKVLRGLHNKMDRPAVAAFLGVMQDAASQDIERVAKELNGRLSTLVLEAMDGDELQSLIREIAA